MKRLFFQPEEDLNQFSIIINECGFVLDCSLDSRFDGWMIKEPEDLKPGIKTLCIDKYLNETVIESPLVKIEKAIWTEIPGSDKWDDMTDEEILNDLNNPENQRLEEGFDLDELFDEKPFIENEDKVMSLLTDANNLFSGMEQTHPVDMRNWVDGIHKCLDVISSRIVRRDYPSHFPSYKLNRKGSKPVWEKS